MTRSIGGSDSGGDSNGISAITANLFYPNTGAGLTGLTPRVNTGDWDQKCLTAERTHARRNF